MYSYSAEKLKNDKKRILKDFKKYVLQKIVILIWLYFEDASYIQGAIVKITPQITVFKG